MPGDPLYINNGSFFYCFRYMPGDPLYIKRILKDVEVNRRLFQQKIDEHRESYDDENPRDFIDVYLGQMEEQERTHNTSTFSGHTP